MRLIEQSPIMFPSIVNSYYKKDVECPEFPWNHRKRLNAEMLGAEFEKNQMSRDSENLELENQNDSEEDHNVEDGNQVSQENDQEGSMSDDH